MIVIHVSWMLKGKVHNLETRLFRDLSSSPTWCSKLSDVFFSVLVSDFFPKRCTAFAFPQYSENHTLSIIRSSQDWQAGHRCYWQLSVSVSCCGRGVSSFKMIIKDVFPCVYHVLSYHDITCHRSVAAILCINGDAYVASCFTSSSRFAKSLHTLTIWVHLFAWSLWWFPQHSLQSIFAHESIIEDHSHRFFLSTGIAELAMNYMLRQFMSKSTRKCTRKLKQLVCRASFQTCVRKGNVQPMNILHIVPIVPTSDSTKPKPTHSQSVFHRLLGAAFWFGQRSGDGRTSGARGVRLR